ncbi:MAG: hypothetical protein COA78_17820, partial [Blastopirellula sp.]
REINELVETVLASNDAKNLSAWWLYRLLDTPDQLQEKMTLFWHGHFATGAEKVREPRLMYRQNQFLREHALGRFPDLVQGISRDPAMLIYLDSVTNRKSHPNENYAREVMELFCLGEGNYTEKDVQEVARCFTGWEIRREKFRFNQFQHDTGEKTILGETGPFGGEKAVNIILKQKAAPRFIVRKMIRYFMFDEPKPSDALVDPLAEKFFNEDYDIARLVERILTSQLFFSEYCIGRKVRSPIEFAVGLLRGLESKANVYRLRQELAQLGQELFYPPNVKGWDGGRAWINSSTLLGRANLVRGLIEQAKSRFTPDKLAELADSHHADSPEKIVDWLVDVLFSVPLPAEVRLQLVDLANRGGSRGRNIAEVIHAMSILPEFQIG